MSIEEEEEDEEEECSYHDSLDRILSSTNTSCSCSSTASDQEEDDPVSMSRFPTQNYEVWISPPLSVVERRVTLLHQMGLTRQPYVPQNGSTISVSGDNANLGETSSVGCCTSNVYTNCGFNCYDVSRDNGGIVRSGSGGDCDLVSEVNSTTSVIGIGIDVNNDNQSGIKSHFQLERSGRATDWIVGSTVSPNELPNGKMGVDCCTRSGIERSLECGGENDVNPECLIKNLDNGKEFVVNEVREDGTWEKIKEVGTGSQLAVNEISSEMRVGTSPIVQELMRRQNVEDGNREGLDSNGDGSCGSGSKLKKWSWLKSIKDVASSVTGHRGRRSSDEKDTSSERGGRRSSSATDDSQEVFFHGPEGVRVKQYGKSVKELTGLYKNQEIQAHNGSIWTIRFSLDGKYLASAGEDCVIHVWQVLETERNGDFFLDKSDDGNSNLLFLSNGSPEASLVSPNLEAKLEKNRRGRSSISRKSVSLEQILVPETMFALSEKPICSFQGHLDDVLDLSWSKSQLLLSSSMDKTVRLWDLCSKGCLKIFSHSDYVTCIQFNPIDDRYFISGSLDAKVRIWSIPDHQVVDWNDLHEMVTAACYTPDGQGALVGSYKGSCRLYNTSDNKLQQKCQINLQNKKKKSHQKKITGFQFAPRSTSEVLVTSADSRVRVINGVDLVHKFKGFRNTNSQISATLTSNGKYAIAASEDSHVYVWRHEIESQPSRSEGVTVTQSYELFHCKDASVAIPWPGISDTWSSQDSSAGVQNSNFQETLTANQMTNGSSGENSLFSNSPRNGISSAGINGSLFDRISVTWPEEKLLSITKNRSPRVSVDFVGLVENVSVKYEKAT